MYMINVRQENILKTLLRESKGLTINELSIKFDVSARTIRDDLKNINNFIKENGQNINYSTEEKIYYINYSDRKNIEKYFSKYELKSDWKPIEANQREVYILFLLIMNNKTYITTENIADELYLSKTAIANDVKKVSKWIFQVVNKKVKTSKANGIIVDLTESEIRLLISSAIYRNYSSDS
ncbi:HTH domain-containing protein [Clostridium paraputrificum]